MAFSWPVTQANRDAIYDQIKSDLVADLERPSPMLEECLSSSARFVCGSDTFEGGSTCKTKPGPLVGCSMVNKKNKKLSHNNTPQQQNNYQTGLVATNQLQQLGGVHSESNKRINHQLTEGESKCRNNAMSAFCGSVQVVRY